MATSARHLCRGFRHLSRTVSPRSNSVQRVRQPIIRPFSSIIARRADPPATQTHTISSSGRSSENEAAEEDEIVGEALEEDEYLTPENPYTPNDLDPTQRADYDLLSKQDQKQYLRLQNHFKAIFESEELDGNLEELAEQADDEITRQGGPDVALDFPVTKMKKSEYGFWAEEEEDEFCLVEDADDEFTDDLVTTVAQSEVDLHRDIREYTRLAAWDLPLLQKFAKPFHPPNHATPLRFRYTTYMGETHPAQHKVVVEFCSKDLLQNPNQNFKLSEPQRIKLLKLVGVRYNPDTDVVKMSCEKFGSAAQNKRYLGELIGKLIKEAKDKRDMFEDVPLDLRHHKSKKRPDFPEEWKLSGKTVQKVLQAREEMKLLGGGEDAVPVDGERLVAAYVRAGSLKSSAALPR